MKKFSSPRPMLKYFRDSLADADLFDCVPDGLGSLTVTPEEVLNGILKDVSSFKIPEKEVLAVVVCPFRVRSKFSHQTGSLEKYSPVLIKAVVLPDGKIQVSSTSPVWIPRRFLKPNTDDALTVGEMDRVDDFLTKNDTPGTLEAAFTFAKAMLDYVCEMPHQEFFKQGSFVIDDKSLVSRLDQAKQVNRRLIEVYDALIKADTAPGLLKHFAGVSERQEVIWRPSPSRHNRRHLGQFKNTFELSPSQRNALEAHLSHSPNNIVAVSGPPGTGKTTLIQSAIATRRVEAALNDEAPPVIVGSSTNNQAIINILASLAAEDGEGFERWLLKEGGKPVKGFGVYVPSQAKAKEAPRDDIPQFELGNREGCSAGFVFRSKHAEMARGHFLSKCRSFFDTKVSTLEDAQGLIRAQLTRSYESYLKIIDLVGHYEKLTALKLDQRKAELVEQDALFQRAEADLKRVLNAWTQTLSLTFSMTQYLRILGPVKQWRRARLSNFCMQHDLPSCEGDDSALLQHIALYLKRRSDDQAVVKKRLHEDIKQCEQRLAERSRLVEAYRQWRVNESENVDVLSDKLEDLCLAILESDALNSWLDKNIRYRLFMWATRYFEAGFLIRSLNSKGKRTRNEEINLLSYVFPCIVTTFHMAANLFLEGTQYLFEKIDLLIVDEAAQALPEFAGPIFTFSKEALLLGDEKQLEPVRSIRREIDKVNLLQRGVIEKSLDYYEEDIQAFASSSGNLLAAASLYSPKDVHGRLPMLLEHRRCVPEIIGYCNELAYEGALRNMRKPVVNAPWPSFSYAHFEGEMLSGGSSRYNPLEAVAIMEWLKKNETLIKRHFRCEDLKDAVAVLTPFTAQKFELMAAAHNAGLQLDKIGTVHVMQGAERPLVIFSPVYDASHQGSLLFDQGVNMLNVAVSRARDHFIAIGNMSLFDPFRTTSSGQLARRLFSAPDNELRDVEPRKRDSVSNPPKSIRTLEKHREVIRWSFQKAKSKLFIISPFLTIRAMEEDSVFDEIASARARGVNITIYFDPYLSSNTVSPGQLNVIKQRLGDNADLVPVHRTHAKVIAVDDNCLIKGSFNWLSASRDPQYARYEVSHFYNDPDVRSEILLILEELKQRETVKQTKPARSKAEAAYSPV